MGSNRLILVDGSSYIYRAFFALPYLSNSTGLPTNAIYGFARMLNRLVKDFSPTHMAVVFDVGRKTFRTEKYKEYKAHRPKMPADLSLQLPYIKRLVELMGIPRLEMEGFEADDVIGTISKKAEEAGWHVLIVSPDKDLAQLVTDRIHLFDPMNERLYTPKEVLEKFGVAPELIPTYLALVGDQSDNIPGVRGVGPKRAREIISRFGDLETIFKRLDALPASMKKRLAEGKELAELSYQLARIRTDLPLEFTPDTFKVLEPDYTGLRRLYTTLEFSSLLKELPEETTKHLEGSYRVAEDMGDVREYLASGTFAFDVETTSLDPIEAELVGIALSNGEGSGLYIPVGHLGGNNLPKDEVLKALSERLVSDAVKVAQNVKYDMCVLQKYGVEVKPPIFDTMIASYLINPLKKRHGLDELALEHLGYRMISYKEATSLVPDADFSRLSPEEACRYACEDADITLRLKEILEKRLEEEGLSDLFWKIEMPLVHVLAHMELRGVKVDRERLESLGKYISLRLEELEKEIYRLAGEEFNINSPRQLSRILFEKLKLKPRKKTKTGYSTSTEVLEELALEHPLPEKILEYRQLAKLKSTYIDGLIKQIHPLTGRVHTSYSQTSTATGRLSSKNPNLQNIPIRSELGKLIRDAFVAEEGYLLVSADYSQIELRILAALADEPKLKEAFVKGEDIHTRTACEIFGVDPDRVDGNMRRKAKVVNFGIIYGMSAYGLSKELKIPVEEAQRYIDLYFSRYPKVVEFIERCIREAQETGQVKTLFGRKRPVPELFSPKRDEREFGKRVAVNTPIQGTAADIIKLAMIECHRFIKNTGCDAHMILQVHDELVFEVREEEAEDFAARVKEIMEGVAPQLGVPLRVDLKIGKSWA